MDACLSTNLHSHSKLCSLKIKIKLFLDIYRYSEIIHSGGCSPFTNEILFLFANQQIAITFLLLLSRESLLECFTSILGNVLFMQLQ